MRFLKRINHRILIIFFAFGFLFSWYTIYNQTSSLDSMIERDPYFAEEKRSYVDIIGDTEKEEEYFHDELKLESLDSHIFYYGDEKYNFVANFHAGVTTQEIDTFMSVFTRCFVFMREYAMGYSPYVNELNTISRDKDKPYEKLSLRVYIDDVKAFKREFSFTSTPEGLLPSFDNYYENVYGQYEFMSIDLDEVKAFIKKNEDLRRNITVRKTFKNDGVIIVNIRSDKKYSDGYMEKMKSRVEDLAKQLEDRAIELYGTNNSYIGIVLQLQQNSLIYNEATYYNGKEGDKIWLNLDWMDHNFLDSYIDN